MGVNFEYLERDEAERERHDIELSLRAALGTTDRELLAEWRNVDLLNEAALGRIDRLFTLDYLLDGLS